jgi:hypothetical protein
MAIVACFVAAGVFLFVAGTASGLLLAGASSGRKTIEEPLPTKQPVAVPAATPGKHDPGDRAESMEQTAEVGADEPAPDTSSVPTLVALSPSQPIMSGSPNPMAAPHGSGVTGAAPSPSSAIDTAAKQLVPDRDAANPAGAAQQATPASYAVPLAIKVCSFAGRSSAETLVHALTSKGYHATLVQSVGALGRTWFVVKLGPYTEWNAASNDAAHIAVAENVRPVIGPMQ